MIKVLFFARLRAQLGESQLQVTEFSGSVAALLDQICRQQPDWAPLLRAADIQVAVNQEMASWETPVKAQDEVAFFPPVTGG